jgi:putative nucleotidyltransferase with HDIG domain
MLQVQTCLFLGGVFMLQRVRQFIAAVTARIGAADRSFVAEYLSRQEERLFWRMNLPDQRHALNVAYTALTLSEGKRGINRVVLLKSALLHDVGKVKGDISIVDKIITVLADTMVPAWGERWGRYGKGGRLDNLRHAFYIYFHHPERSAAMLREIGVQAEIIAVIARHHKAPAEDDPPELMILRKADNRH